MKNGFGVSLRISFDGLYVQTDDWSAEFAVSGIGEITWATLPFDSLVIPEKKKDILQALVQEGASDQAEAVFDDVVEGKGQGLIILLQ